MGFFFTGFLSGFALTSTALYVTVQVHRSNRLEQRNFIREQTEILNSLAQPTGAYDRRLAPKILPQADKEPVDPVQPSMKDLLKHRWNKEVEALARNTNQGRWQSMRNAAAEGWGSVVRLVKRE